MQLELTRTSDNKPEDKPEQHWYGDEGNKKKLEVSFAIITFFSPIRQLKRKQQIGAGLLGGAALLAGGLLAHKKHEEHKEEANRPSSYNLRSHLTLYPGKG